MLSVLIPTYNYDCTTLVSELQRQIDASGIVAEVIVMDDASPDVSVCQANKSIDNLSHCRLIELPTNVGIARIRNLLADAARYDYMLFLDSDIFPVYDDFLQRYVEACTRADVLCGGLMFRAESPRRECVLRYKYGSRVESQSVERRMQQPYGEFKTLNFFISRRAFMSTRFNEDFVRYGHEDTLFGKELQQNGFSLLHIDNPIYHDVPDTNEEFLAKTRRSIENLCEHRDVLQSHVRLLAFYNRLQRLHLCGVVTAFFNLLEPLFHANLTSNNPSLFVFNLYKVGFLCRRMRG